MIDRETGSEWSHLLGEAKAGPLAGAKLTPLPSFMTNWNTWRAMHPDTTVVVLSRTVQTFQTERLRHGERFGIGLRYNDRSRLWRFDLLEAQPLVNDRMSDLHLAVYFDPKSRSSFVWDRRPRGQLLTFELDGLEVRDTETGSSWDLQTGLAMDGELAGTRLAALPAIVTFRSAWKRFYPDSTFWHPSDSP